MLCCGPLCNKYYDHKGACKYYISMLGGGVGSEGNAYFAYVVRGAFKSVKYYFSLWSKAIYEKISQIYP